MKHEKRRRIKVKLKEKELKRKIYAILDGMTAEEAAAIFTEGKKSGKK